MSDVRSRLAALSPEQRSKLLEGIRQERQAESAAPIVPVDRQHALTLSFAQRRIWFLERLEGGSAAYNMPAAFRLRGSLDAGAVTAALDEIVRRHEVLRTRLVDHDGEPVQAIDPPETAGDATRCRAISLADVPAADREDALRTLLGEEARRAFDLAQEHPFRSLLVRLDPNEHVLFVNLHHVASDGWSTGVLIREFSTLYNAFRTGAASPLGDLPVQYADFAAWQRRLLDDEKIAGAQLDYWRPRLADAPGVVNLPTDAARGVRARTDGDAVYFRIDADVAAAVNALARETDASAYMVLLAAFFALLHRWSGDTDVTVGSPIANRPRKELEGLIGFFVNTLALRVQLDGDPDFLALVGRVRTVALEAYAHADLPFEQIVEKLNPERRLDRSPFFQVMFAMQSGGLDEVSLAGLQIETVPLSTGAARLDMTMSLQEAAEGFAGCLEFSTALFRPATAQRFAEHYRNLIAAAVRQPATPLSRLDYLSHGERHRVLVEWNRTEVPSARGLCLHQLVEEQAARTPDAVALRWGRVSWTYAELMSRAERAAALLQQKGAGPETLVGVCMDRSPDMIAALLGVLRAGGAYVALDPAYPAARTEYVLSDSGASIVLRNGSLDEPLPAVALQPTSVKTSNLAYVLYTSGSTGQPKGVAIEHRSPVALIEWARSVWSPGELRGVLAGTSICFDLSVFEIFLPLSVGGTVILADSVLDLPTLDARHHVTLVNTVPSAIDALLHQRALPSSVRVVNLAGEPLTTELADRVYDGTSVEKVYDLYGPSEDTTYSTYILRRRGDPPSIGRPIANTRLYILDRAMQPVPPGVPGEIYLAGQGLARGYLGRDDLTRERFVPSPFPGVDRLYRTGDRGRFRDDGNVEFLGRFDHQVKLRGFRIELGEIEAALRAFPGVAHCVVIVEEGQAGNKRLVGYVAHPDGASIADALHAHLRTRLPEYMVPPVLVVLDALPLTPNGKIDRKALPSPELRVAADEVRPLTPQETRLAAQWGALLAVETIQPGDDFFGLGGHSLLAARLAARIRDEFRVELPLRAVFEHPTLRAQAAAIAGLQADPAIDADPIPMLESRTQLPLSFAQERLWFLDQLEPGSSAYNMSGAIRLLGDVDLPALALAFDEVVERHETLRTVFPTIDGRASAAPCEPRPALLKLALRRDAAAPERHDQLHALLKDEQARPFDLARGPLIRAAAIGVGAHETVLVVTMHHIISDGWSVDVLLDELCRFYTARISGSTVATPPLEIQYADFAAWQRARFESGQLASQLGYWRNAMADAPVLLELPTDRPRPAAQSYQGAVHTTTIDAPLASLLAQRTRELGVTSFMMLLTAFGAVLNRWSGQDEVVVGFPAAGRSRSELEGLIGMFVNTVPIRLQVGAGMTFEDVLGQVKTRTLDALTNQDVPFEKLVDELGVQRDLSWSPVFQVMFIMQEARTTPSLPDGLRVEAIAPPPSESTKFDLTLAIADRGDDFAVSLEYDRALFDAATIERLGADFVLLLRDGLERPGTPLASTSDPVVSGRASRPRAARPVEIDEADGRPATAVEAALSDIWRQVLRLDRVRPTDNFFEIGGDSIVSIQVIARLRDRGWRVEPKQIFRHQTIRALAAVAEPVQASMAQVEEPTGPLPVTPMQRLFFSLNPPSPNHFNQALLLSLDPAISEGDLQAALSEVQRVHPALRSRFRAGATGWEEHVELVPDVALECHDLSEAATVPSRQGLDAICQRVQRSLDLAAGPVFRAALVRLGPETSRLLLVAHHLIVDAVSWRVILADLESACAQARLGQRPLLPPEHCGPATFRRMVRTWLAGDRLAQEARYWNEVTASAGAVFDGLAPRSADGAGAGVVTRALSDDESRPLLAGVHRAYNTNVADLLLAAFGRTLCAIGGRDEVLVDVEGHGRDALQDADLSRSVGWFTALYPVRISCPEAADPAALIRSAKESTRSVPHGGIGFGLLQWQDAARDTPAAVTDVCFNYLGQASAESGEGLFRGFAPESAGDQVAGDLPRRYRLELNASVVDGRLVTQYSFDAGALSRSLVEEVADRTLAVLRDLIAHCLAVDGARYTPSDFATLKIDQQDLDTLLNDLDLSGLSEA